MWKWEKRGHYSVKSGYKELSRDKDTMCRGMYHQSSVWNSIWSVTAPSKVKNFLWRACAGSLPTKQCLISRMVEVSEAGPIFHGGAESVFHILTSCPFAKECWSLSRVDVYAGQSPIFPEWLEAVHNKGNKEACSEIAMLCWAVTNIKYYLLRHLLIYQLLILNVF